MTIEEAKAILSTHRVGELDPADARMREALELAASSAELAAWWENEQAFDRAYARKLASITPPRELAAIIMRGGATIFFARRMISDSTGDPVEEPSSALQEAVEAAVPPEKLVPFPSPEAEKHTPPIGRWWWRMVPLSVAAMLAVFCIVGLFLVTNSQKLIAQSNGELPAFRTHAANRTHASPPPVQNGVALNDVENYLTANGAPDLPKLPDHLGGNVSVTGVSIDTWSTHRYTYLTVQVDGKKMHLFVLNQGEFPNDDVDADPDHDNVDSFVAETWTEGSHVFILLRPAPAQ